MDCYLNNWKEFTVILKTIQKFTDSNLVLIKNIFIKMTIFNCFLNTTHYMITSYSSKKEFAVTFLTFYH